MHPRYLYKLIVTFVVLTFPLIFMVANSYAAVSCSVSGPNSYNTGDNITINASGFLYPNVNYYIQLFATSGESAGQTIIIEQFIPNQASFPLSTQIPTIANGTYDVEIKSTEGNFATDSAGCASNISITNTGGGQPPSGPTCSFSPASVAIGQNFTVTGRNLDNNATYLFSFDGSVKPGLTATTNASGFFSKAIESDFGAGQIPISITKQNPAGGNSISCGSINSTGVDENVVVSGENPCQNKKCVTALGVIPTNPQDFVTRILQIATGIGGGIALILLVIGSIRILTSAADQQRLAGGRDMMIAAISGLLFIIFSVVILRFIGISLLGNLI